jgi:XTP/dITP diphosphohydrolase
MPKAEDFQNRGLEGLVSLMDLLRSPGGCPWDAEQTHESLGEYLLEETYELLDVLGTKDKEALKEELGDLLLQVVFHARIASEDKVAGFDLEQVANDLITKLVSRHPHVFDKQQDLKPEVVKNNWEKLKAKEKNRTHAFEGVPRQLPALLFASKILVRLEKYQPDFSTQVSSKVEELIEENATDAELGQILLEVVKRSKDLGLEPEIALRNAVLRLDSQEK